MGLIIIKKVIDSFVETDCSFQITVIPDATYILHGNRLNDKDSSVYQRGCAPDVGLYNINYTIEPIDYDTMMD